MSEKTLISRNKIESKGVKLVRKTYISRNKIESNGVKFVRIYEQAFYC